MKDGSKYVIKIWNEKSIEDTRNIVDLTVWMGEQEIPTPIPFPLNPAGDRLIIINNMGYTIYPFIEGEWITREISSLYSLGAAVGRLHKTPQTHNHKGLFAMGFPLFDKLFTYADSTSWTPFLTLLKTKSVELKDNIPNTLPRGLIHGDLFPSNVLSLGGKLVAILDLEECCLDYFALDLAMAFVGFGWEEGEPVRERWEAILLGYQSVRILTPS